MSWKENIQLAFHLIPLELLHTCAMVFGATCFGVLLGMPLGIFLWMTRKNGIKERISAYRAIGFMVNVGRSVPFAILIVALIPVTRWIVGTSIGTASSMVPLSLAAAPFIARIVEGAFLEVRRELIETAQVMGASCFQVVRKILIPEALPSLVSGLTLTAVNLIGYSAMAGLVGGGGLGKIAVQYGYQRFNGFIMAATLVILLALVEGVQWMGGAISRGLLSKRGLQ